MDYSGRVNSKKGSGGVADVQETAVHTRNRIKELLATQVLDLDNDPYVFRNHLGLLECRLCLTTHISEASYISHLGGKKHLLNLQKRRILDEKSANKLNRTDVVSITNVAKRSWNKIGKPSYNVTKIRNPQTLQLGLLITVKYPKLVGEPLFRFMNYYELNEQNQDSINQYNNKNSDSDFDGTKFQYLIIYGEPYDNICIIIPGNTIDKPNHLEMSDSYWWHWDNDIKQFYLQFLYKLDD